MVLLFLFILTFFQNRIVTRHYKCIIALLGHSKIKLDLIAYYLFCHFNISVKEVLKIYYFFRFFLILTE